MCMAIAVMKSKNMQKASCLPREWSHLILYVNIIWKWLNKSKSSQKRKKKWMITVSLYVTIKQKILNKSKSYKKAVLKKKKKIDIGKRFKRKCVFSIDANLPTWAYRFIHLIDIIHKCQTINSIEYLHTCATKATTYATMVSVWVSDSSNSEVL